MKITMVLDLEIEAGQLAQRLAHQPRLQTRQRIAHLAFEFGLRHQRRNRIDHQHVDPAGAHQRVADFQRLFAGVGLRDQQFVDVDAQLPRIDRIERVFGVDEGADAALLLPLRHRVQRQRGFARGFRPVDFDHPSPRQAADTQRDVQPERARGNRLDIHRTVVLAQLHHRALAELALDLGERGGQGLGLIHGGSFDDTQGSGGHSTCSLWRGFASGTNGAVTGFGFDRLWHFCTTFVLCSQYVLFRLTVLAVFNPLVA